MPANVSTAPPAFIQTKGLRDEDTDRPPAGFADFRNDEVNRGPRASRGADGVVANGSPRKSENDFSDLRFETERVTSTGLIN